MDELSEEDKLTVERARKIQRFMSQPFAVAQVFTGIEGKLVSLKETVESFKQILGVSKRSLEGAGRLSGRASALVRASAPRPTFCRTLLFDSQADDAFLLLRYRRHLRQPPRERFLHGWRHPGSVSSLLWSICRLEARAKLPPLALLQTSRTRLPPSPRSCHKLLDLAPSLPRLEQSG